NDFVELSTYDQYHAEVASAVTLADFVNRNDAWIVQLRGSFRFHAKALHVRFCRPVSETNHFERHNPVETFLPRAIHHALATASDFFEQFVVAEIFQHPRDRWCKRFVIFVLE